MAKRKHTQTEPEVQVVPETPVVTSAPVVIETSQKTPKKRIRIRKKATKKLSAAIICQDPTIQRFI